MANIYTRSPHIIEIDESGVTGSKIELFIYYAGGSAPTNPQYTLEKAIPSSSNLKMYYDVSPYLREYINFDTRQSVIGSGGSSGVTLNTYNQYVIAQIKTYKLASGTYTLLATTSYFCFDGYGYYSEGANPNPVGPYFSLDEGTYYYKANGNPTSVVADRAGLIGVWDGGTSTDIKYTDLSSGATHTISTPLSSSQRLYDVPAVWYNYYTNGNKVEFITGGSAFQTYYFKPKCEPKYTPVLIDFVNKQGYWQREWFYKASKNSISTNESIYNVMQSSSHSYSTLQGQRRGFNNNGEETIICNTGNVAESYFETIQQILLSERILIDSLPVTVDSKSMEKNKGVNKQGNINYTLTFKFAFDMINSVI